MKHSIRLTRSQIIAVIAVIGFLTTWATQTVVGAYQKGVAEGKSIRVAEINTCSVNNSGTKARFSGCNSIL